MRTPCQTDANALPEHDPRTVEALFADVGRAGPLPPGTKAIKGAEVRHEALAED